MPSTARAAKPWYVPVCLATTFSDEQLNTLVARGLGWWPDERWKRYWHSPKPGRSDGRTRRPQPNFTGNMNEAFELQELLVEAGFAESFETDCIKTAGYRSEQFFAGDEPPGLLPLLRLDARGRTVAAFITLARVGLIQETAPCP